MDRRRVNKGVTEGGQFAVEAKAEAAGVALLPPEQAPIILSDGEEHNFDGDGEVFAHYSVQRNGDEYFVDAEMTSIHLGPLLMEDSGDSERVTEVMNRGDWTAMKDFINERYKLASVSESGDDELLSITVGRCYQEPPTEKQIVDDVWNDGAKIANESDSGTFGSEFLGRLLRNHLDNQVTIDASQPIQAGGRWYPHEPLSISQMRAGVNYCLEDEKSEMDEQVVAAIAFSHRDSEPVLKQLVERGYADHHAIQRINDLGYRHLTALKKWAANRHPFTERLDG